MLLNIVGGGIAVGLVVGCDRREVRRRVDDPPIEVALALLSSYFAYLPAEALGVSGVLAAVTVGVYHGLAHAAADDRRRAALGQRVLGDPASSSLNSALFVLVGLQLHGILDRIEGRSPSDAARRRGADRRAP